jgi:hypothetical protein
VKAPEAWRLTNAIEHRVIIEKDLPLMDIHKNENVRKAPLFSFWIAPVDNEAESLLQGIEGMFDRILGEYNIYLAERVEDSYNETFSLDLRYFQSLEEMNKSTNVNKFCGFQCKLKTNFDHPNQCKIELAYNFPISERQSITIHDKERLIPLLEDLLLSIVLPGMIGFDYADFANMLSKSSSVGAHSIFKSDSRQGKELLEFDKNTKHNIVVLFSFSNKDSEDLIKEISQWSDANYDDKIFNVVYYSCILRNNEQEPDRRSIFIGRDIGGSDGKL